MESINPAVRILDTRTTNGGHLGPLAANDVVSLQVLGSGAAPLSGVKAVMLNLTAVSPTGTGGYLTAWPSGTPRPATSNVNFPGKAVVANACLVGVGANGAVSIYSSTAGMHVIVDVQGWEPAHRLDPIGPLGAPPLASAKVAQILANANRYLLDTWWPTTAQTLLAAPLGQSVQHDEVRRLAMAALGLSLSEEPGAPEVVAHLVEHVAGAHLINAVDGWGSTWQSTLWAGILGRAAWISWAYMPGATKLLVARVIEHEANFAARQRIHYLRDTAGTVLTPGDTGAEEVSWHGTAMQIAAVMLPDHPNAWIWEAELQRFAIASCARPQDVASLAPRIAGSNVESDGIVINHNRVAPDYATCVIYQNLDGIALYAMAGRVAPVEFSQLVAPIYAALVGLYVPGTAQVTYPQGCDWGTGQMLPYAVADAGALKYGCDTTGQAAQYLDLHLDAQLAMQARHADGHTYEAGEYLYEGAEEHVAALAASLRLAS